MELKFDWNELRKNKIFIATPMYGGQCLGTYTTAALELQGLLISHGVECRFSFLFNESLIPRARNYLVDEFLRSGYTHLLFIDADIRFNPIDIVAMLHMDKDIIGGPYPKKALKWSNVIKAFEVAQQRGVQLKPEQLELLVGDYVFNPVPGTTQFNSSELLEVMEIGTGFMLVKREVFEKFKQEYPHLSYKPDHAGQANFDGSRYIHAYFHCDIDPVSHRYLSEDYFFCQACREIGIQIWYCPWMKTGHTGTYEFKGDIQAVAALIGQL